MSVILGKKLWRNGLRSNRECLDEMRNLVDRWNKLTEREDDDAEKRCQSFLSSLAPRKETPVPTGQEDGWAPEPVWTWWRRKNLPLPVIEPRSSILTELPRLLFLLAFPTNLAPSAKNSSLAGHPFSEHSSTTTAILNPTVERYLHAPYMEIWSICRSVSEWLPERSPSTRPTRSLGRGRWDKDPPQGCTRYQPVGSTCLLRGQLLLRLEGGFGFSASKLMHMDNMGIWLQYIR
jgi:hypothetical protein